MPGDISKKTVDGVTVVTFSGELDLATVPALHRELRRADDASLPDLVVDLSGVTFCDCAIVGALKTVRAQGGCLRLRGLTGGPKRLFDLCHLDGVIWLEDTATAARGTGHRHRTTD